MKTQKNSKYICEKCQFISDNKNDYRRHLTTSKHKNTTNTTNTTTIKTQNICICGKEYNDRAGLWRHKKKCQKSNEITGENVFNDKSIESDVNTKLKIKDEMIIELQKQLIDALNKPTTVNNTQNNNNQFNLQVYLNETCSNAINIDTLLKNIKVTIENVIEIGEIGYSKGIGNLIAKHIKGMNQIEKPIQTTDVKRGLSWIKNKNNEWIKDEDLTLANNFIFLVGDKYFREYADGIITIKEWKDTQSKIHDKVVESINQITKVIISDDKSKDYSKIHKTIAESTMVKK